MPDEPIRGTQETGAPSRTAPPGGTAGDGKGVERTERAVDLGLHTLRPRWRTRRIVFIVLVSMVLLLIGAGMAYWRLNAGLVKTDNAQTGGELHRFITPAIANGRVYVGSVHAVTAFGLR